jgi:WD40 repeat protein
MRYAIPSRGARALAPVAGLLVLLGLAAALTPGFAAPPGDGAAAPWKALAARADDPKADPSRLWDDLVAFRQQYPGTPEALEAARVMRRLPSPLDTLDPEKIPELDHFAWQPKELVAVLGEHRGRHGYAVAAVTVSPDGNRIASVGGSQQVRLFDAATLRPLFTAGHGTVTTAAFSPDGKRLATADFYGRVILWDVGNKELKEIAMFPAGTARHYAVAFSPDGKTLAVGSEDSEVHLCDVADAKPRETLRLRDPDKGAPVRAVAFAPKGKALAVAGADGAVRLWDLSGERPKEKPTLFKGHANEARAVAFSPDGTRFASAGTDGKVIVWSASAPGKPAAVLDLGKDVVANALAWSPKGDWLAAGDADGAVRMARLPGLKKTFDLKGHTRAVRALAATPDGKGLVSGSDDCTVRLWDLSKDPPAEKFKPVGPLGRVPMSAFSPDGRTLATAGNDGRVCLWDLTQRPPVERRVLPPGRLPVAPSVVAFSPDGRHVAAGHDGSGGDVWRLWDVSGRAAPVTLRQPEGGVAALAFSPDGRFIASAGSKAVVLWDVKTHKEVRRFEGHEQAVASLAFSGDGTRLLTGGGWMELPRDAKGKPIPDAKFVPHDCAPRIWDVATGRQTATLPAYPSPVLAVALSPDGRLAATCQRGAAIRLYDLAADPPRQDELRGAGGIAWSLAVSPDGTRLASNGPDDCINVWELGSGKRTKLSAPELDSSVAFAPDGRHIAVSLGTGPVYILRLEAPK